MLSIIKRFSLYSRKSKLMAINNHNSLEMVAVNDSFGESGTPDQLMEKYGLTTNAIVEKALKVIARKK
jgi:transketolase